MRELHRLLEILPEVELLVLRTGLLILIVGLVQVIRHHARRF